MMEQEKWLMPEYYQIFKCKCEKCRHSCCHGWEIPISKKEYESIMTMPCDDELYRKIQLSFINPEYPSKERFKIISYNYLGDCPIQEKGLCRIHAQMGENKLPAVCRLFPRSLKEINGQKIACCSSSCERVVEMLLESDNLKISYQNYQAQPTLHYNCNEDLIKELIHYSKLLQDHHESLAQSIATICLEIDKDEFEKDFNKEVSPLKEGLDLLKRLTNSQTFLATICEDIFLRYQGNYYQFEIDKEKFEKDYPNWQTYFKNVINNSILFEGFPFVDERFDKIRAYKGLCASYGLLRIVAIGHHANHKTKEDLVDAIASLFHLIDHTSFYYNVNIIAPAAALLLKI